MTQSPRLVTPKATAERPADVLNAVQTGDGPPAFYVADEEACFRALPPCTLPDLSREALEAVALRPYAATVWLPSGASEETEVPDDTWQGWEWPAGATLLLFAHRDARLPGVPALTVPAPGLCCLMLAGRPMLVRRFHPGHPAWRGDDHAVEVTGFLDDRTSFWALIRAPSPEQRERLLAALATLSRREAPDPQA